jgi:hypothetical protein
MRSIPMAMTWETLRRGWWSLITFGLAVNILPCLLYTALGHEVAIDPLEKSQLLMHIGFLQIYALGFGVVAISATGAPSRLYALPIRTSTLVALQMLLAALLVAAEILLSTAAINAVFGLGWPLWAPALFGAVAVAVLQAVLWLADRSFWIAPAIACPGAALGLWYKAHYGSFFSFPTHYWEVVTPLDVATLALVAAGAYGVAVVGVARNRRGETPLSIGLFDRLSRVFAAWPERGAAFGTPGEAQLWFEWRKKGWAMPAMVILGLLTGLGMWLLAVRGAKELFEGAVAGGAFFVLVALMIGFLLGHVGGRDFRIDPFFATRPMTTTDMAWATLKCAAKSLLFGWLIWAASLLAVMGALWAMGVGFAFDLPEPLGWWYLPATLVGAWAGFGFWGPLAMGGRGRLLIGLAFGAPALLIGLMVFWNWALSLEGQVQFLRWGLAGLAIAVVAGTAAAYVAAYRRSLIRLPAVLTATSAWGLLTAASEWGLLAAIATPLFGLVDAIVVSCWTAGVLALAVSPLATAPLALAWNRNR